MKEYPSITKEVTDNLIGLTSYIFKKYDGSNIRAEWQRKKGWVKFGSRTRLLDGTDPILGPAIPLFQKKYGESLARVLTDSKEFKGRQKAVVFCEFLGPNSFAGTHVAEDQKDIILFDVEVHQMGIIGPKDFMRIFYTLGVAELLEQGRFNRDIVEDVRSGKYPVDEGVIAKFGEGHNVKMLKIKTRAYLDRLKNTFPKDWEQYV